MAQRFDNQRGTAPIVDSIKNEKPKLRYSKSDLSAQIAFDAHIGWVIPFDLIETLPDSDYTISYDIVAITRNPLVRRLLSGMSVFIHTYGEDLKDMWEGFPRFITRGRSGTASLQIPTTKNHFTSQYGGDAFCSTVFSPSSYLGVPPYLLEMKSDSPLYHYDYFTNRLLGLCLIENDDASVKSHNPNITFNALPLVMYQQICIHNYMPANLVQHNKNFYPDNELHLILADDASGQILTNLHYDTTKAKALIRDAYMSDVAITSDDTPVYLDCMRVRQFRGDEFTTGLPFPDLVRGDIPVISQTGSTSGTLSILGSTGIYVRDIFTDADSGTHGGYLSLEKPDDATTVSSSAYGAMSNSFYVQNSSSEEYSLNPGTDKIELVVPAGNLHTSGTLSVNSSLTMSQLRSLAVLTKFREMMARTDGSYNEMIKAQFGSSPQLHNHKPFYIGGIKQELIFSEVVQTSESSSNNPLGKTASRGVTAGSGYVGKYHSKDYGYIMSVLSIVPDIFYHQGLDKKWSRIEQSDFYFPINNNLSPEALLNKRLYISGVDATDNDLFAYQERDSDYKSRRNRVAGRLVFTATQSEEDNAYVMKRTFSTTPTLSYGFVGMFPSNIDMSIFASMNDTPFIFNIASRIEAVQPMPYTTVPSDLGIVS